MRHQNAPPHFGVLTRGLEARDFPQLRNLARAYPEAHFTFIDIDEDDGPPLDPLDWVPRSREGAVLDGRLRVRARPTLDAFDVLALDRLVLHRHPERVRADAWTHHALLRGVGITYLHREEPPVPSPTSNPDKETP